ncbi:unnamed protein product [Mytilus coruscus]|uniref:Uncharacterized protein n=1 Tax=Mytilus coruscus TaxID=42192 RepID=A0A6J8C9Q9_MYTCO|nr:unnamed protein product [Mytilus coruscus]
MLHNVLLSIFSVFTILLNCGNFSKPHVYENGGNDLCLQNELSISLSSQLYYWQLHVSSFKRPIFKSSDRSRHVHLLLKLLLSNQVETNPRPNNLNESSYPCTICSRECTWNQDAIVCDNCDKWCHAECVNISSSMYEKYGNTLALWSFLSTGNSVLTTNSFSCLSQTDSSAFSVSLNDNTDNIGNPVATSSPKPVATKINKRINRQTSLRVLNINFRSCKNKVAQIENLITSSKPDIIIGNETWLNKDVKSSEIFPSSLFEDVFRRDRECKEGGGVLIAIKKGIICQQIYYSKNVELIAAQIDITDSKSLIIVSVYRPPSKSDINYFKQMLLELNDLKLKFKNSTFWISGDLNLPDIDWPSMTIEGKMYPKEMNEIFLDLLNNLGLDQLVNFPTRKDNILDIFCTNQPNLITKIKSIPGISDHNIVLVDAICKPKRATQCPHKIFVWKKVDLEKLKYYQIILYMIC